MSFMPEPATRLQPVSGPIRADILIVGTSPDVYAIKSQRPFAHARETILHNCLHQAGLITGEVVLTNFAWDRVNHKGEIPGLWRSKGAKGPSQVKGDLEPYKKSLWSLIQRVKPKVIVPLGDLPTYVLCKTSYVNDVRGYPYFLSDTGIVVVPSLEPSKMVFSNYEWRDYLAHDLLKARKIANNTALVDTWDKCKFTIPGSFQECVAILDLLSKQTRMSWDIEVSDFHTSCMGFCWTPKVAVSIPIDMRWTEHEELYIWQRLAKILEDPGIIKVVQNGVFDVQFMAQEMGIFVKGYEIDTMTSHHIVYPDYLKGLGFLASIHTMYPYWKDELEVKTIKEES